MSQVRFIEVHPDHAGQRLDNFLLRELKGVPKTRIYRALRKGEIRVNKGRVRGDYRVSGGDSIRIPPLRVAERENVTRVPRRWQTLLATRVLYEDNDLLALDKPSGLAVHGGSGLSMGLIESIRVLRPEAKYLELVHRLDRDTSGCILIAKKPAALRDLHRQLRDDEVEKRYLALVSGQWHASRRFVEAPLKKNSLVSGERMVRVDREGKPARTAFAVLERFERATLVEARPVTGRTHQIRVHAQRAGHPILGDEKYGDRSANQWAAQAGLRRLFLHAAGLGFRLPGGQRVEVTAELDRELQQFLGTLRRRDPNRA